MAIQSLTYLDIPIAKRRESAARALAKLRERMSDPTLTDEQRQQVGEQAKGLELWAAGKAAK